MTDEQPETDATPASATLSPSERRSRRRSRGIWGSIVCIVLVMLANSLIKLDYFVVSPGSAVDVARFTDIPADKTHAHNGGVLLTTVSFLQAHPADIVWAWMTPGNRIESKHDALGTATPKQYFEANREAMDDSQMTAISVAMRKAGYAVQQRGEGAVVTSIGDDTPASGKLRPGDVITSADGRPVGIANDVSAYVRSLAAGSRVTLHVTGTDGVARDEVLSPIPRPEGQPGVYVGVLVETKNAHLDMPFPVKFKETNIGGPSAGLAFTLALLDQLTPGDLTGGKDIATTGTMNLDGSVGPVGGVEQKAIAVSRTKAKLFLVPSSEVEDARKTADKDVKIVPADTLDQALSALSENGGDISGVPGAPQRP